MSISFEEFLEVYSQKVGCNDNILRKSKDSVKHLKKILDGCGYESLKVEPYGSTVSGFFDSSSDVDLCIVYDSPGFNPKVVMNSVVNELKRHPFGGEEQSIEYVSHARIPVIKVTNKDGLKIDITMSSHSGAAKNHIISVLREYSPSLRYLYPLVKSIFKVHFLNCSFGQSFSSYCLLLLTVAFLQEKGLLPPLWKLFSDEEPQRYDERILDRKPDLSRDEVIDMMKGHLSSFNATSVSKKDLLVDFLYYLKTCFDPVANRQCIRATTKAICPLLGRKLPLWAGSSGQFYLVVEDPFTSLTNSNASSRYNPLDNTARAFSTRSDGESSVYFVYHRLSHLHYILQHSVYSLYSLDSCGASSLVQDKTICPDSNGRNLIWLAMLLFGPTQLKMVRKIMFKKFESNSLSNWEKDLKEKIKKFLVLLGELLNTILTVMNPRFPRRNFSQRNTNTSSLAKFAQVHFLATKSLWHYVITKFNPNHSVNELNQLITSNPSMPIITTWFDWSTSEINVNAWLESMFRIETPNSMNEATDMIFQSLSSKTLPFHDPEKAPHQSLHDIWEFFCS